jgi:glycosyltransferase involved in cell wall biosynthesis
LKILIVSQFFWPENFRINEIAISLRSEGFDVDILTGQPNYPEGRIFPGYSFASISVETWNGINIYRVPIITRGSGGYIRRVFNYLSFVFFATLFGPFLLRSKKYDAVLVYAVSPILQAIPAIFVSFLKKSPLVIWVQDLWPDSLLAMKAIRHNCILIPLRYLVKMIYQYSDLILVQSKAFILPIKRLTSNKKIIYYPNSVDSSFCSAHLDKNLTPKEVNLISKFSILFAGNVGVAQAVNVITQSANSLRKNRDIHFFILGHGSRFKWMSEEIKRLKLKNITLLGRFPSETMPAFMKKASVLLVTLGNHEVFSATLPNKLQAYMAIGKPILASMNGEGARVINEAKAGFTSAAENSEALVSSILKVYAMKDSHRKQLGKNAKKYFKENFDHDFLVKKLIHHLKSL